MRRAPRQSHPVPLTMISELLNCDASSPYTAVARFGLPLWVRARLRERLTSGAHYGFDAQIERTVRFNAVELERHARFVLALRSRHQGKQVDGVALAKALAMPAHLTHPDALTVWLTFLTQLVGELLDAVEYGHLEDMPWSKAERFLDLAVVPRVRKLATTDMTAEPLPNFYGGIRRVKRVLEGLGSKDPDVVRRTLQSWDYARLRFKEIPDPTGFEGWSDVGPNDHDASAKST